MANSTSRETEDPADTCPARPFPPPQGFESWSAGTHCSTDRAGLEADGDSRGGRARQAAAPGGPLCHGAHTPLSWSLLAVLPMSLSPRLAAGTPGHFWS